MTYILSTLFLLNIGSISANVTQQSATGRSSSYRNICKEAAFDEKLFKKFRSMEAYHEAVECGQGNEFAKYILETVSPEVLSKMPLFSRLDKIGNPVKHFHQGLGAFSGTTLRYIIFADLIFKFFDLPAKYTVAEIGAGFGGQAYVLSKVKQFGTYYIYDLPEVELLISRVAENLGIRNIILKDTSASLPEKEIDLFISNYALSECDLNTQLDYIERVASKAKRGFILFNDVNVFNHLNLDKFITVLQMHGKRPEVLQEPVHSYDGNKLIVWGRS